MFMYVYIYICMYSIHFTDSSPFSFIHFCGIETHLHLLLLIYSSNKKLKIRIRMDGRM